MYLSQDDACNTGHIKTDITSTSRYHRQQPIPARANSASLALFIPDPVAAWVEDALHGYFANRGCQSGFLSPASTPPISERGVWQPEEWSTRCLSGQARSGGSWRVRSAGQDRTPAIRSEGSNRNWKLDTTTKDIYTDRWQYFKVSLDISITGKLITLTDI